MKFQPDTLAGVNSITRFDSTELRVNAEQVFNASVVVPWKGQALAWNAAGVQDLTARHFESLLAFEPEVVIFGSGARLQFVSPALYRSLIARRVGIETMDSGAACRTYNVLANEGRKVVGAFILAPLA